MTQPYDYDNLFVRLVMTARTPEATFTPSDIRPQLQVQIAEDWLPVEIARVGDTYRYNLRNGARVHFSRHVLVQGDAAEMLTLDQVVVQRKQHGLGCVVALPEGIQGLPIYLKALSEYLVNKEAARDDIESSIRARLREAGVVLS